MVDVPPHRTSPRLFRAIRMPPTNRTRSLSTLAVRGLSANVPKTHHPGKAFKKSVHVQFLHTSPQAPQSIGKFGRLELECAKFEHCSTIDGGAPPARYRAASSKKIESRSFVRLRGQARSSRPLPTIKRGDLHPVAASPHAAPSAATVPGAVVEIEAAGGIRAAFQPRPVAVAEEITR